MLFVFIVCHFFHLGSQHVLVGCGLNMVASPFFIVPHCIVLFKPHSVSYNQFHQRIHCVLCSIMLPSNNLFTFVLMKPLIGFLHLQSESCCNIFVPSTMHYECRSLARRLSPRRLLAQELASSTNDDSGHLSIWSSTSDSSGSCVVC